jgi:lipoyltransferase 1
VDVGMKSAYSQRGFQLIRPEEDWFPGLAKIREDFQSHTWIFGKTPNFKVRKQFLSTRDQGKR